MQFHIDKFQIKPQVLAILHCLLFQGIMQQFTSMEKETKRRKSRVGKWGKKKKGNRTGKMRWNQGWGWALWWLRQWRISQQCRRPRFDPWAGKISRRREWQPSILAGESHWQTSLVDCSPWVHKEVMRLTHRMHADACCPGYTCTTDLPLSFLAANGDREM